MVEFPFLNTNSKQEEMANKNILVTHLSTYYYYNNDITNTY